MNNSEAGYSITEQVFERREMAQICEALAAADLLRTKAGARHVLRVPAVRALAAHPALVALAATFIGEHPVPFRATLFDKSAASNWLVVHASSKASDNQPRRVLHIEYAASVHFGTGIELAVG